MTLPRIPKSINPDAEKLRSVIRLPDGRKAYKVFTSARGIGDAITAFYAACGAAEANPNCEIWLQTHQQTWLSHAGHPRVKLIPDDNVGANCNVDYHLQKQVWREGKCQSRAQWYANAIAAKYGFDPFKPYRRPTIEIPKNREVIVSPFSNEEGRTWPIEGWPVVIRKLLNDGYSVRLLGAKDQQSRMRSVIDRRLQDRVVWDFGRLPVFCLTAISQASYLIGNDSGLAHIAGLVGTPFLVIAADYDPRFVFPPAEVFDWVGKENGSIYNSLNDIKPSMVIEAFDRLAFSCAGPLQSDTPLHPSFDLQRTDQSRS